MTGSGGASPAEQHLGDRLAALVDGELGHDMRERVLAHLATCCKCRAEADAQRRLKNVFAEAAPPPPSAGLLARLQSLPAGDGSPESPDGPFGGPVSSPAERGPRSGRSAPPDWFTGGGAEAAVAVSGGARRSGFRVHEFARRPAPSVSALAPGVRQGHQQRSRRFAFAAAGAVSLAAFALGGALPLEAAVDGPRGRADTAGTADRPGTAGAGDVVAASVAAGDGSGRSGGATSVDLPQSAAPAGPGTPTPTTHPEQALSRPAPLLPADAALSPLIRHLMNARLSDGLPGAPLGGPALSPSPTTLTGPSAPTRTPEPGNRVAPLAGGATATAFLPPAAR
ncbi:zf-HC2 domain-containing protein [Streptomyces sp. WAC 00631]|uniref:zf-HC2 domain-containing protein n=1 Tax=Streptomyces sp. WAC 00631 TaxID=2203201 RepID=UPI001E634D43|nr:zf-HC2 domain-containing protein [Streptomyces sp. WAC 00631]MCC5035379.1 zf-HC2 domain-containing protein [Streptomyces sp. WAC 00631]